jgi:hypothetical protein
VPYCFLAEKRKVVSTLLTDLKYKKASPAGGEALMTALLSEY